MAGGAWLTHFVWGQTAEAKPEKTFTITQSQLDDFVAKKVAMALAAEREKAPRIQARPSDEQGPNPQNWHKAIFNKAEYRDLYRARPAYVSSLGRVCVPQARRGEERAPTVPASSGNRNQHQRYHPYGVHAIRHARCITGLRSG